MNLEQLDTTLKRVFDQALKQTIEAGLEYDDNGKWAQNVAKKVVDDLVKRAQETLEKYIEPIGAALYDIDTEARGEFKKSFRKRAIQRLKQGKWDVQKKG